VADKPEPDPMQGVFRWAWRRGPGHVDRLLVGGVGFSLASYAANRWFTENPLLVLVIGIVGAFVVAYGWALFRAPFEQRDVLRVRVRELDRKMGADAERQKRLRSDREVTGETFHVWELIDPAGRPLVENRIFRDCVLQGPGLVKFFGDGNKMEACKLGVVPYGIESVLYEEVLGMRQGLIGFINCEFVRSRFEGIGFYGDKAVLDQFRALPII
jgi:hypothetical protein